LDKRLSSVASAWPAMTGHEAEFLLEGSSKAADELAFLRLMKFMPSFIEK
jgi:hypothetical protein